MADESSKSRSHHDVESVDVHVGELKIRSFRGLRGRARIEVDGVELKGIAKLVLILDASKPVPRLHLTRNLRRAG